MKVLDLAFIVPIFGECLMGSDFVGNRIDKKLDQVIIVFMPLSAGMPNSFSAEGFAY